jgi:hypothetical protein
MRSGGTHLWAVLRTPAPLKRLQTVPHPHLRISLRQGRPFLGRITWRHQQHWKWWWQSPGVMWSLRHPQTLSLLANITFLTSMLKFNYFCLQLPDTSLQICIPTHVKRMEIHVLVLGCPIQQPCRDYSIIPASFKNYMAIIWKITCPVPNALLRHSHGLNYILCIPASLEELESTLFHVRTDMLEDYEL